MIKEKNYRLAIKLSIVITRSLTTRYYIIYVYTYTHECSRFYCNTVRKRKRSYRELSSLVVPLPPHRDDSVVNNEYQLIRWYNSMCGRRGVGISQRDVKSNTVHTHTTTSAQIFNRNDRYNFT